MFNLGDPRVGSLFAPDNVCVVGASERAGAWGRLVIEKLGSAGYEGRVFPVNARYDEVLGRPCYPTLTAIGDRPDHVAVLVGGDQAVTVLEEAVALGARSATVYANDFGEDGSTGGRARAARLSALLDGDSLALCGPNCAGNIGAPSRFLTVTGPRLTTTLDGPVAVVSQSGGVGMALSARFHERGLGVGYMVSTGNEVGLTAADYIAHFATRPGIRVVVAYLESVRSVERFTAAVDLAEARGVAVVVLKLGGSPASRAAASTHTGAVVGALEAFDAVLRGRGAIRVSDLDELVDTAELLAAGPPPRGPRVGIVTTSGGMAGLLVEHAVRSGSVELAAIDGPNPVDTGYPGITDAAVYGDVVEAVASSPEVDAVLVQGELPTAATPPIGRERLAAIARAAAAHPNTPVTVVAYGTAAGSAVDVDARRDLGRLSFVDGPARATRALANAVRYRAALDASARRRRRSESIGGDGDGPHPGRARAVAELAAVDGSVIDEVRSKAVLAGYGLGRPDEAVVVGCAAAAAWAARARRPVAVKLISPDVVHKAEVGGVALDLRTGDEVEAGAAAVLAAARRSGASVTGLLVTPMLSPRAELVLGAVNDPEVGPIVLVGRRSTRVEDPFRFVHHRAPMTEGDAIELLDDVLAGGRLPSWWTPAHHDAAAAAIVALADAAWDLRDLVEAIDVNPLAVLAEPAVAVMLDAVVVPARPAPSSSSPSST